MRPQDLARGGLSDWLASSSQTIQAPRAAAVLLPAATPPSSTTPQLRRHVRSPAEPAAATTSHGASAAAMSPPPCSRRGTTVRSESSPGPASTAGQPSHGRAGRAPTPAPVWQFGLPRASDALAIPSTGRPLHPAHATDGASAPPTARSPAARPRSPGSSRRSRSDRPLPAGSALLQPSWHRSNRRPARISHPTATDPTQPMSGERPDITQSSSVASAIRSRFRINTPQRVSTWPGRRRCVSTCSASS